MECRGSVAFYAKTDSSNVLLKALNYCPDGMSAKELNVAHALENEILLLLLRKGYFLESIMCGYSEETGASQRLIFLVER
ncbi:MAG: hypothetical protein R2813_07975 [Flavobacteriales bacterium]